MTGGDRPWGADGATILRRARALVDERAAAAGDARVTVGSRQVLVEFAHPDGGLAGVAHRPAGRPPASWPEDARSLTELAVADGADRLSRAVGIASLNALSAPDVAWRAGDPMAALGGDVDVVATVGLFRPAFRKFGGCEVRVVERDPPAAFDVPDDVTATVYPPENAPTAFEGADVCFVTGSTLVYGGVDRYVAAAADAGVPLVVLVGATASFRPEPAFDAGFDLLAGARVTDRDAVRERVRGGDCGTDLHDHGLEKVWVAAREDLPGLTLGGEAVDDTRDGHDTREKP